MALSANARYMAPVSRLSNPYRAAMRAATVLLPAPAGPSMATISGEFWFSLMLLASYALVYAADSRPVTCPLVFHPAFRLVSHPVFRQTGSLVFHQACCLASRRLTFRQTCLQAF